MYSNYISSYRKRTVFYYINLICYNMCTCYINNINAFDSAEFSKKVYTAALNKIRSLKDQFQPEPFRITAL